MLPGERKRDRGRSLGRNALERGGWHLPQLPLIWQLPDKARIRGCGPEEEEQGARVIFADRPAAWTFEFDGQMLNRRNNVIA